MATNTCFLSVLDTMPKLSYISFSSHKETNNHYKTLGLFFSKSQVISFVRPKLIKPVAQQCLCVCVWGGGKGGVEGGRGGG